MASPRKIRAKVDTIEDHGNSVYTLEIKTEKTLPRFKPGQFLHLTLDEYNPGDFWPESRVFSIACSYDNSNMLRISYSVVGKYTMRMENELREGMPVWIKLPYGDFIIEACRETVLVAGGTGITAFISFIEELTELENPIHLIYGAREKSLLLYQKMILQKCEELKMFRCTLLSERDGEFENASHNTNIRYLSGLTSTDIFWDDLGNPFDADYYLAGPPGMIETVSSTLTYRGIDITSIYIDAWQ